MERIYLSPPDVGPVERAMLLDAFDSNWVAPVGPHLDAFEDELATRIGVPHALATSSGTAALHLALRAVGVAAGSTVLVSDLTFIASVAAASYLHARPIFVDSERQSWNLDPQLVADYLVEAARSNRLPAAVVAVDLYGQCADYDALRQLCTRYEIPLVADAAESLGATYKGRPAGSLADVSVLSFNGNKMITTSSGGMVLTASAAIAETCRHLANQAREPALHYEHQTFGYNYRLSNLLAALGRGQLTGLDQKLAARRANNLAYREALADLPGIGFAPVAPWGEPNAWLTVITIDPALFGATTGDVQRLLADQDIESRPAWKPMHLQPVYRNCRVLGGAVGKDIFATGLCLPSGSSLPRHQLERVAAIVASAGARDRRFVGTP